jgi:hypothetical protein
MPTRVSQRSVRVKASAINCSRYQFVALQRNCSFGTRTQQRVAVMEFLPCHSLPLYTMARWQPYQRFTGSVRRGLIRIPYAVSDRSDYLLTVKATRNDVHHSHSQKVNDEFLKYTSNKLLLHIVVLQYITLAQHIEYHQLHAHFVMH